MQNYKFSIEFNLNSSNENTSHLNINNIFLNFGVPNSIIEVGSFEGRTTIFMSDTYSHVVPKMDIYCVDPHNESFDLNDDFNLVKENFLHNINICKNKNIHYVNKNSEDGLIELINKNVKAQFIYIDGDHRGSTVLSDLVLSFKLLEVNGIILCDDVNWRHPPDKKEFNSPSFTPRMAVENFIQVNWHRIQVINIPDNSQTAFIKTSD